MLQKGFSTTLVIVSAVFILSAAGFFIFKAGFNNQEHTQSEIKTQPANSKVDMSSNTPSEDLREPPLKLKSIGVNFEDFKFTKGKLQFDRLFMGYGFVIPGNETIHFIN